MMDWAEEMATTISNNWASLLPAEGDRQCLANDIAAALRAVLQPFEQEREERASDVMAMYAVVVLLDRLIEQAKQQARQVQP